MGPDRQTHRGMLTECRYSVGHAEMRMWAEILWLEEPAVVRTESPVSAGRGAAAAAAMVVVVVVVGGF